MCTAAPTVAPTHGPTPASPPVEAITGLVACAVVLMLCACYCIGLFKVRTSSTFMGDDVKFTTIKRMAHVDTDVGVGNDVFNAMALQTRTGSDAKV